MCSDMCVLGSPGSRTDLLLLISLRHQRFRNGEACHAGLDCLHACILQGDGNRLAGRFASQSLLVLHIVFKLCEFAVKNSLGLAQFVQGLRKKQPPPSSAISSGCLRGACASHAELSKACRAPPVHLCLQTCLPFCPRIHVCTAK